MNHTIVSSADVGRAGRTDAAFHCLVAEHRAVYDELTAKFTRQQLAELARRLPFDRDAAKAVVPPRAGSGLDLSTFMNWVDGIEKNKSPIPRKHSDLAAYCAAAAHNAAAKILTEVLALAKKKQELLNGLTAVMDAVAGAPLLLAALKGKTEAEATDGQSDA